MLRLVQQEKCVSVSNRDFKHHSQQILTVYNIKLVTTLSSSVDNRLSHVDKYETFIAASILDIWFKLSWRTSEAKGSHPLSHNY